MSLLVPTCERGSADTLAPAGHSDDPPLRILARSASPTRFVRLTELAVVCESLLNQIIYAGMKRI
jgi:hypothetical protein